MPDSDSEAVYEFTQDAQHSDLRDPHRRRRRSPGPDAEPSSVLAFWRLICDTFRKIVDSKYFGRGIMIAILVNTLSMGIEYHEQVGMPSSLALDNCFFPWVGSSLWLGGGDGETKQWVESLEGEHNDGYLLSECGGCPGRLRYVLSGKASQKREALCASVMSTWVNTSHQKTWVSPSLLLEKARQARDVISVSRG